MIKNNRQLLLKFLSVGYPRVGMYFDFKLKESVIRILSEHFGIEFAVVFELGTNGYYLYAGERNYVAVEANGINILLNHTHPAGTQHASPHDINWLHISQDQGSPQKRSIIYPIGKPTFAFTSTSRYIKLR